MLEFGWWSRADWPPGGWDLRYCGWLIRRSSPGETGNAACWPILVDWRRATRPRLVLQPGMARGLVLLGVDSPVERARLMKSGFGEALGGEIEREELVARVRRVRCAAQSMRRQLRAGPVTLDLFHRDGRVDNRWLGLHPREFALFWRLVEAEGERVSRHALLADVWRLEHDPESNRLEVHVSRLRSKLAVFRLSWLVATDPRGGYRLHSGKLRSAFAFGMTSPTAYERALVLPGGEAHRGRQQEGARADAGTGERQGFGRT